MTYRIHRSTLELSLWNGGSMNLSRMLATILGLITVAFALVVFSTTSGPGSYAAAAEGTMATQMGMALLLLIAWGIFLHHILWTHLGREVVYIGTDRFTVLRDFRIYKSVIIDRPYSFIQVSGWTDVKDENRTGWLILTCDEDVLKSRVSIPAEQLDEATDLIRGYLSVTAPGSFPLRAVGRN